MNGVGLTSHITFSSKWAEVTAFGYTVDGGPETRVPAVDGKGVLGPIGRVPGLFAAIPGDAGYTLGPLSARLVAEMMAGRAAGEDMAPFSPDRFG